MSFSCTVVIAVGFWGCASGEGDGHPRVEGRQEIVGNLLDKFDGDSVYLERLPGMPDDECEPLRTRRFPMTFGRMFADSNYVHLAVASDLGIAPIGSPGDVWSIKRPIVKITSCEEYYVDTLTHSYPYLVTEAADLLHDIGRRFIDSLSARGGGAYRIRVTSILRTNSTVKRLRRVNVNASESSAHAFATTFDISYNKFICDDTNHPRTAVDLKNLLAEIIAALRDEGRCYVKYERKQGCFHITARKPQALEEKNG